MSGSPSSAVRGPASGVPVSPVWPCAPTAVVVLEGFCSAPDRAATFPATVLAAPWNCSHTVDTRWQRFHGTCSRCRRTAWGKGYFFKGRLLIAETFFAMQFALLELPFLHLAQLALRMFSPDLLLKMLLVIVAYETLPLCL